MTTHIGKIARLSKRRREDVSRRMENGLPGGEILKWLNKLKDVKAVLKAQFGGRAINQQNLTAWRRSGYVEWLRLEEARGRADRLVEKADALAKRAGKRGLGDRLAILLALEMDGLMESLVKPESDPEKRWERVREMHREVSRLRRDDDRVRRTSLREESKAQSRKAKVKKESDWPAYRAMTEVPQGVEAAREAAALFKGEWDDDESKGQSPESKVEGHEDEGAAANEDDLRQIKADHSEAGVQSPESKVQSALPRIVERTQTLIGNDFVKIQDKKGFWCKEVPKGWQLPADWKSPEEMARRRWEAERNGQSLKSEAQSLGTGDEVRGINGRGMKHGELQDVGNTGLESPVNSQTGMSALQAEASAPPYVPNPDPKQEAYIQWWLMHRGFKPLDSEALERLYAAIPKEEVRSQESEARMNAEAQRGVAEELELIAEGAGI